MLRGAVLWTHRAKHGAVSIGLAIPYSHSLKLRTHSSPCDGHPLGDRERRLSRSQTQLVDQHLEVLLLSRPRLLHALLLGQYFVCCAVVQLAQLT